MSTRKFRLAVLMVSVCIGVGCVTPMVYADDTTSDASSATSYVDSPQTIADPSQADDTDLDITVTDAPTNTDLEQAATTDPGDYEVLTPDSITPLPGGGESVNYLVDGITNSYLVPPNGFNPLKASDDVLAAYGLPPRPTDKTALKTWKQDMKAYKHIYRPNKVYTKKNEKGSQLGTLYTPNWSGVAETVPSGSSAVYRHVYGDYTQPQNCCPNTTDNVNRQESTWVGIGGINNQQLIQCGTAMQAQIYYYWYEYLSADSDTNMVGVNAGLIYPGDHIHVAVDFDGNTCFATFTLQNVTRSTSAIVKTSAIGKCYNGATAEWIDERPTVNQSYCQLANFNTVNWSNCYMANNLTAAGSYYPMSQYNFELIQMEGNANDGANNGKILSYPTINTSANTFVEHYNLAS